MFSILGFLGGLFSGIGGAIKGYFYKKSAEEIVNSIDKNVERVIPVAQDAIKTTGQAVEAAGKVSESVATVTTNIAEVAKSDNTVAIEMHKQLVEGAGSWLTNNVRPIGFLVSFGLLIAQLFGYVPPNEWPLTICLTYMGARTVDKLGQIFTAATAVKALTGKK